MTAAIEVYNKPKFEYREETFSILAVNAWELLLKAFILKSHSNKISEILQYECIKKKDGTKGKRLVIAKNTAGNSRTISLGEAISRIRSINSNALDSVLLSNLDGLVALRDNAIHFFNDNVQLKIRVHELGAAGVKNFVTFLHEWFDVDLTNINFTLLPLAFVQPKHLDNALISTEEENVIKLLNFLEENLDPVGVKEYDYSLCFDIVYKSKKKGVGIPVINSNLPNAIPVRFDDSELLKSFPWDYDELIVKLRNRYSNFKQNDAFYKIKNKIENDPKLCVTRFLDPIKRIGTKKKYYSQNVINEFDNHYERKKEKRKSKKKETKIS